MSPDQSDWLRNQDWERALIEQQMQAASEQQRQLERQRLAEQEQGLYPTIPTPLQRQSFEAWREQALQQQAYEQQAYEQQQKGYAYWRQIPDLFPPQPTPLTEGTTPNSVTGLVLAYLGRQTNPIMAEIERLQENTRRQQARSLPTAEQRQERARVALGTALSEAVAAGLLTEERAVTMIVTGGLNDRPIGTDGAINQVVAALAQAVQSGVFDRASADAFLARVGGRMALGQGQVRPSPLLDARQEADEQLERRDDLIYTALTICPCHLPEHQERHRASVWVCDAQAATAWGTMLLGLGIGLELLPRVAHLQEDGERAACCQQDGNIGTWLRWGQLIAPSQAPTPEEQSA